MERSDELDGADESEPSWCWKILLQCQYKMLHVEGNIHKYVEHFYAVCHIDGDYKRGKQRD